MEINAIDAHLIATNEERKRNRDLAIASPFRPDEEVEKDYRADARLTRILQEKSKEKNMIAEKIGVRRHRILEERERRRQGIVGWIRWILSGKKVQKRFRQIQQAKQ